MSQSEPAHMPTSNPLPPPPRPGVSKGSKSEPTERVENLSNQDFRKLVMETPRRGGFDAKKDKSSQKGKLRRSEGSEAGDGEAKTWRKNRPKPKDDADADGGGEDLPAYRDRAKERRDDRNPDYVATAVQLGTLNAVAPPGATDFRTSDAHRISIENSKFLGGDVEHTHLVKGLDFALLHKVRDEIVKKGDGDGEEDEEDEENRRKREKQQDKDLVFRTPIAKLVFSQLVRPQSLNRVNETFLPGRTQFIFDMDEDFRHEIPTTVHRSKSDCPPPPDAVAVGVDGAVLERIAKIMTYLRLGSAAKVKKKKKDKDGSRLLMPGLVPLAAEDEPYVSGADVTANGKLPSGTPLPPPPPPPPPSQEKSKREEGELLPPPPPPPRAANPDDDIFGEAGTDYEPTASKARVPPPPPPTSTTGDQSPGSEDMDESPGDRERGRRQYFDEPSDLAQAQPPPPPGWQGAGAYPSQHVDVGPAYPPAGGWQDYPQAPPPGQYGAAGAWGAPGGDLTYPPPVHDPYQQQHFPGGVASWYQHGNPPPPPPQGDYSTDMRALPPPPPPGDPLPLGGNGEIMSQQEKDKGMGSVFSRDDGRLGLGRREEDKREKDPSFVSASYSECYPDYKGFARQVAGGGGSDDDDEDEAVQLDKMDLGAKAKGRLHRWDFESEEEWAGYNAAKEAMPKAAFQFGVKTADGRKTRKSNPGKERDKEKDRDAKLSNELNQINKILDRKKREGGGGGGGEDDDGAKRARY